MEIVVDEAPQRSPLSVMSIAACTVWVVCALLQQSDDLRWMFLGLATVYGVLSIPIARTSPGLLMAIEGPTLSWKVLLPQDDRDLDGADHIALTDVASIEVFRGRDLELQRDDGTLVHIPVPRRCRVFTLRDELDAHRRRLRAGLVGSTDDARRACAALAGVRHPT
ncbi:MAG: hypothetical protein H6736_12760 [Alphaproteobacteria bacterium]|nr:hypothetical protein [Alphaproteobacteria bacterium]